MPVQIHLNGQRYFADDGTDPAELQQLAQMHQEEQRQLNPINQGMQNVFSGINRQIQQYNELPAPTAVPGNTYGMSTQAFNQTAGIIQQDNMNSATARMQQRVQMEQAMEQEKDRAQQIKVQDMQFKNQQKLEKMKQDQEEARLRRERMTPKPVPLPNGGFAEYMPGVDGQQGTINTLREPAVKPVTKSYTTIYGADGTAYGVNRADPSEVISVKDPITGEPIRRSAGQTGKRLVNDASGIPYLLDMATGDMESAQVPEGFAAKSPAQNNSEQRARAMFILRDVQNKENQYFKEYGDLKGFNRPAAEADAAAAYDRVNGAAVQGGAPAQVGMPANPVVTEISQEDMQARDWALANPNDFRSTAILQHINAKYGITQAMTPMVPAVPTERATPASSTQVSEPISATAPAVDVAVPSTVPQQAPTTQPKQPLFDPFANPSILFRNPEIPAGSVTIPYQNQKSPFGTIFAPVYR